MGNYKEKTEEVKARAFDLYANDQFVCSEAVLYTINGTLGNPFPAGIVRLASGFGGGIGNGGYVCGALTGGVMALGWPSAGQRRAPVVQSSCPPQGNSLTGSLSRSGAAVVLS